MYVNDETRTLLKIMKFRAIGLWHGELMHNAATMESYSKLLHEPCDEDEFALRVGRLLLKSLQDGSTLGATLASRLCPEFASIFWAQLSDRLIGQQECDYKNFGIFRSSRATGQIRVAFEPSDVVLRGALPESMLSTAEAELHIDNYCRSVMDRQRQHVLDWPDFGPFQEWWLPLTITTLLAGALDDVLQTVGASEQVLKLVQERPQVLEHGRDWLSILSMATSYASYYAWANAFGTVLEIGSAIEVDGIGRFHKAQGRIEFEAHTKFQNLLDVNIPLARQFAA